MKNSNNMPKLIEKEIELTLKMGQKVALPMATQKTWGKNKSVVAEILRTLEVYGFTMSVPLAMTWSHLDKDSVNEWGNLLLEKVKEKLGAYYVYTPMYPDFPEQVMNASEVEIFINNFVHAIGLCIGVSLLPKYSVSVRQALKDETLRVIELGEPNQVKNIISNFVTANTVISAEDKVLVAEIIGLWTEQTKNDFAIFVKSASIPNKENLAFWGNVFLKNQMNFDVIKPHFAVVTDVLRLVVAYSGGDASLAEKNVKIAKLSRAMRKELMSLLNDIIENSADKEQILENLSTYRGLWLRVAYAIHVGEYAEKYPQACEMIQKLRNNEKVASFSAQLEKAFQDKSFNNVVKLLKARPGVFARTLSRLLVVKPFMSEAKNASPSHVWSADERALAVSHFKSVADKVATPVLLQVHAFYKNINHYNALKQRSFMPKGSATKMFMVDAKTPQIDEVSAQAIVNVIEETLVARFASLPEMGNVFIAPEMKEQIVPFALRSASKALRTVARGSKLPMDDSKIIRFFLWWKNAEKSSYGTDIDLSAVLLDENLMVKANCAFYDLRGEGLTHSGDIRTAPEGACEFIDVDRSKLAKDVRYLLMVVHSYSGEKYVELPECFAGWMGRSEGQTGEIFEARTVKNRVDLTSDAGTAIPVLFDLVENKAIWLDLNKKSSSFATTFAGNEQSYFLKAVSYWKDVKRPNLYDLFELHAKARGTLVNSAEEADQVFALDKGVTPYDYDIISAKFMGDEQ